MSDRSAGPFVGRSHGPRTSGAYVNQVARWMIVVVPIPMFVIGIAVLVSTDVGAFMIVWFAVLAYVVVSNLRAPWWLEVDHGQLRWGAWVRSGSMPVEQVVRIQRLGGRTPGVRFTASDGEELVVRATWTLLEPIVDEVRGRHTGLDVT